MAFCLSVRVRTSRVRVLSKQLNYSDSYAVTHLCEQELDWLDMKLACIRIGPRFNVNIIVVIFLT